MQAVIFSLIVLALVIYIIYKIKKSFTKKDILIVSGVAFLVIISFVYYGNIQENKLPEAFKAKYLNEKNLSIGKISFSQTNLEVLSSQKGTYDFIYIIKKDKKEYVCEAKDVEVQKIQDEYVFKKYKEECRLK